MNTEWKVSKCGVFLVRIFLYSDWVQENKDQKQLPIWTIFTHWKSFITILSKKLHQRHIFDRVLNKSLVLQKSCPKRSLKFPAKFSYWNLSWRIFWKRSYPWYFKKITINIALNIFMLPQAYLSHNQRAFHSRVSLAVWNVTPNLRLIINHCQVSFRET